MVDIGHVPCSPGQSVEGITQFQVPVSTQLTNSDMHIAEVPEIDDGQEEERWIASPPLPVHIVKE